MRKFLKKNSDVYHILAEYDTHFLCRKFFSGLCLFLTKSANAVFYNEMLSLVRKMIEIVFRHGTCIVKGVHIMEHITYSQMRILETAQSFRQLNIAYGGSGSSDDIVGTQLAETVRLLEEAAGVGARAYTTDSRTIKAVKRGAAAVGVKIESVMLFEKDENRVTLSVTAKTAHKQSIRASEISECLSAAFGKDFVPSKSGRSIITENPCEFIFEEAPVFYTLFGVSARSKSPGVISGDSYTYLNNCEGNAYMALADGMGTGSRANMTSSRAVELFEQFAQTGFSEINSVRLINAAFAAHNEDNPVAMDCAGIDLLDGKCRLVKMGAASTFVKDDSGVKIIRPSSLPAGVLEEAKPDVTELSMGSGQYIFMLSDGVADALPFYDKENQLARIIDEIPCGNPQMMADSLMEEVLFYLGEEYKDDMTVLALGIWRSRMDK